MNAEVEQLAVPWRGPACHAIRSPGQAFRRLTGADQPSRGLARAEEPAPAFTRGGQPASILGCAGHPDPGLRLLSDITPPAAPGGVPPLPAAVRGSSPARAFPLLSFSFVLARADTVAPV